MHLFSSALAIGLTATLAAAHPGYMTVWNNAYPTSTLGTRMQSQFGSSCYVCHQPPNTSTAGTCYKDSLAVQINDGLTIQQAIQAVDGLDADGDGFTNGMEIRAPRPEGGVGFHPGLIGLTGTDPCGPNPSTPVTNRNETPCASVSFATQPLATSLVCPGPGAALAASAAGTGSFAYQWKLESPAASGSYVGLTGASFSEAASGLSFQVSGGSGPALTISNIQLGTHSPTLRFVCTATNTCGNAATSNAAVVTVRPAFDRACGGAGCDADVNQDGNVDQDDLAYLINVIGGGLNPTGIDPDFNQDGNADQDDVASLVNVVAGGPCP